MQVVEVPGTAPADGFSLGDAAAGVGAGAGLGAIVGGGGGTSPYDPQGPIQQVEVGRPETTTNPPPPPSIVAPGTVSDPTTGFPGKEVIEKLPIMIPGGSSDSPSSGGTTGTTPTSGMPGLQDILKGLAPWLGGINDYKNSKEDAEWWKSQIDTLQGMYRPGTPEAEQMRQKMEARDAASGRRSQYGIREVNLATNLAERRAGIMTSAGYQNMANAYRNRDSQSLNSLFAASGNSNNLSNLSGLISGLGGLFGGGTPPTT
jgi:hypothetical protein